MTTARISAVAPPVGVDVTMPAPRPRVLQWFVFTLFVVVAFFALIYSRTSLDDTAFIVQELDAEIELEEARYWQLRREVAELEAPARIKSLATEMGMIYPEAGPTPLNVPGLGAEPRGDAEARWAELKSLLSAQP